MGGLALECARLGLHPTSTLSVVGFDVDVEDAIAIAIEDVDGDVNVAERWPSVQGQVAVAVHDNDNDNDNDNDFAHGGASVKRPMNLTQLPRTRPLQILVPPRPEAAPRQTGRCGLGRQRAEMRRSAAFSADARGGMEVGAR